MSPVSKLNHALTFPRYKIVISVYRINSYSASFVLHFDSKTTLSRQKVRPKDVVERNVDSGYIYPHYMLTKDNDATLFASTCWKQISYHLSLFTSALVSIFSFLTLVHRKPNDRAWEM